MTNATEIVAPRMLALKKLEKTLKRLDLSWKVIETTARVVCPPESAGFIATLEHTRSSFSLLAGEMVEQIAATHLNNHQCDLAARAQVAIDILVRNLFERTADVGFIATDGPLVAYTQAPDQTSAAKLYARLQEYRAKYTVYDDILVLDASAQILLGLQPRASRKTAQPHWWQQAMASTGYIESYAVSDLFPATGPALVYAHRIESASGQVCGAVVLKFDLQSELRSIFKALLPAISHMALVILDELQRVVACSDPALFSELEKLPIYKNEPDAPTIFKHQGGEYLLAHCHTRGYQGYAGPGWTAAALIRLDDAFQVADEKLSLEHQQAQKDDANIEANNPKLQDIVDRARAIEEDLNRVIWNGKLANAVTQAGSSIHPVFEEIGRTSKQTIDVFQSAIVELRQLLMAGRRAEMATHAALAVNIMDRNLYERANDCRWWALSEEFASLLLQMAGGQSETAAIRASELLAHLNSLYTVYRRVALFDRHGRICAVSRDPGTLPPGLQLPSGLLQQTLALRGSQAYTVSDMLPNALADGAACYLYCAPIRAVGSDLVLGGMALAFNCADELQAMLRDAVPSAGTQVGFYVDHAGRVLASTHQEIAVGKPAEFAWALTGTPEAVSSNHLLHWQGQEYLVGKATSPGYREFKTSDGYRDDVTAYWLTPVQRSPKVGMGKALPQKLLGGPMPVQHYGVVQCGKLLLGLDSTHVIEAISAKNLAPGAVCSSSIGMLVHVVNGQSQVLPAYDAGQMAGQKALLDPTQAVAIVVRSQSQTVVLLVDRLVDVIRCDALDPPPNGTGQNSPWIDGLIHDSDPDHCPVFTINPNAMDFSPVAMI